MDVTHNHNMAILVVIPNLMWLPRVSELGLTDTFYVIFEKGVVTVLLTRSSQDKEVSNDRYVIH